MLTTTTQAANKTSSAGEVPPEQSRSPVPHPRRKTSRVKLYIWLFVLVALALGITYRVTLPPAVHLISPETIRITESIAVTGSVKGRKESAVGAQTSGTVESLLVREGDKVKKGQLIATVRNSAAVAAVDQARQAVNTAEFALAQAQIKPLPSDLEGLKLKTLEAQQSESELRIRSLRSQVAITQAKDGINQAEHQLETAQAALASAQAQQELAQKKADRANTLYQNGAVSQESFEEADTALKAAQAATQSAQAMVNSSKASLDAANQAYQGAVLDSKAARSQLEQAASAERIAHAAYVSLSKQPLRQNVDVARARVRDAQRALETAIAQAQYSRVLAPYDGLVTAVISDLGSAVSPSGIVQIAEMGAPQISANLDENDMSNLRIGQKALLASSAIPTNQVIGKVIRVGPEVDFSRGTVEVRIVPVAEAGWLMPGQTVNVNLINSENVKRLSLPANAVVRQGSQWVAFEVFQGKTAAKSIRTGPEVNGRIPILSGLSDSDRVVANASSLSAGVRVRVVP